MTRHYNNWLDAYLEYSSITEAPQKMHIWTGISAIAGCLRRKVWIDMIRYKWYPSFYVIFVAPPGVVAKSTTIDIGMKLLRDVPAVHFGPDIITWQALVQSFAGCSEQFQVGEEWHPMSAMTLAASELGNLINPQDREMLNLYISLYDGVPSFTKQTKTSGNDVVVAPWLNMIGCTTPHWIADNMPLASIGGGFTSRCIFVYAEKKEKYIPYVDEMISESLDNRTRQFLIDDLTFISENLAGRFTLTKEARDWGRDWYETFWGMAYHSFSGRVLEGYAGRKYTHLHKTAMILSVAKRDDLVITREELEMADKMLKELEPDMEKVFSHIGKTEESLNAEVLLSFVRNNPEIPYAKAYQHVFSLFPNAGNFEGVLSGLIRSGQVELSNREDGMWLKSVGAAE